MSSPEGPSFPSGLLSGGGSPSGDEGFFPFVLERRDSFLGGGPGPEEPEDLALQLQQKEKDLLLAAELGKMLLERNEELQRQLDALSIQHLEREEVSWQQGRGGQGAEVGRGQAGGQGEGRGAGGRKAGQGDASGRTVQAGPGAPDSAAQWLSPEFRPLPGCVTLGKLLALSESWLQLLSSANPSQQLLGAPPCLVLG